MDSRHHTPQARQLPEVPQPAPANWQDRAIDERCQFYTVAQFGALIGVKRARAHVLIASGAVASLRMGRRIFVPRRAVEAMIDESIAKAREVRDAR